MVRSQPLSVYPTLQVGVKILVVHGGRFLLIKRSGKVYPGVRGTLWDIPGGRINPANSLYENLRRELWEEVGLSFDTHTWEKTLLLATQDIWVREKNLHVVRLTYLGKVTGKIILSEEHVDYKFVSFGEILKLFDEYELLGQVIRKKAPEIQAYLKE